MTETKSQMPLLVRLVAASLAISKKSAKTVQSIFKNGDLKIEDKGGLKNYQTIADRKIEQLLIGNLEKHFPGIAIVGEEGEAGKIEVDDDWIDYPASLLEFNQKFSKNFENKSFLSDNLDLNEITIWLDPLDGTAEFIDGFLTHVTTLIGVAYKGKPVAGVINQPFYKNASSASCSNSENNLGRSIWGIVGVGAFGFERQAVKPGRILTTTRSHMTETVKECIESMAPTEVLRMGGSGNKVLQLIENNVHAYIFASPGTKKWDTCAPEAILLALDGKLTDVHGNLIEYHKTVKHPNSGGVIAAVNDIQFYLDKIPKEIKDKLEP